MRSLILSQWRPYQGNRCPVPLCCPFSVHQRENLGQKALQKQCEIGLRFGCLKSRRKSDWRPTAAVMPTYFVLEFNMNRRI